MGPNAELPDIPEAAVVELRGATKERVLWRGQRLGRVNIIPPKLKDVDALR